MFECIQMFCLQSGVEWVYLRKTMGWNGPPQNTNVHLTFVQSSFLKVREPKSVHQLRSRTNSFRTLNERTLNELRTNLKTIEHERSFDVYSKVVSRTKKCPSVTFGHELVSNLKWTNSKRTLYERLFGQPIKNVEIHLNCY